MDFKLKKELIYESSTADAVARSNTKRLSFIHFNDVYNIESRTIEPVGGASRFVNAVDRVLKENPSTIVLFSGDAFNPSMLSMILKGRQMVGVLNDLHITAACIGNHDFDFGIDHLVDLTSQTNFPWLLSNVLDILTEKPLANGRFKHMTEVNGVRIGFLAVVEEEWICTLSTIDYDELIYEGFVEAGRKLARELRTVDRCDVVIALTHMRMPNDQMLARDVPEIDLVLGGHDHDYNVKNENGTFILKSGSDFREFSVIDLSYDADTKKSEVKRIERVEVDSSVPENEKIKNKVDEYMVVLVKQLEVTLGEINSDLDGRFLKVRTEETNLGNFMCDIVLEAVNADCVIINSGTFRSDVLHPKGEFKVRDLKSILPFLDTVIMLACTGKQIHEALENGVSQYPKLDGRFPQVAGVHFKFDPSKPPYQRIDVKSIKIQGEQLHVDENYLVATKSFLREGKDGYDMFKPCEVIIDDENGPQLITLIENHFKTIEQIRDHAEPAHRPSIVSLAQRNKLIVELSKHPHLKFAHNHPQHHHLSFHTAAAFITRTLRDYHNAVLRALTHEQITHIKDSDEYKRKMHEFEEKSMSLKPVVEGRIICLKH